MSVPTRGPIFELITPRIRPDGYIYTEKAIEDLMVRLHKRIILGELNTPIREHWMGEQQWLSRIMSIEETRAVNRLVGIGYTSEFLYAYVRPVANNLELFESGDYVLAPRAVFTPPDDCGRKHSQCIVTLDLVSKHRQKNPTMHTLFAGGTPGYTYGVSCE